MSGALLSIAKNIEAIFKSFIFSQFSSFSIVLAVSFLLTPFAKKKLHKFLLQRTEIGRKHSRVLDTLLKKSVVFPVVALAFSYILAPLFVWIHKMWGVLGVGGLYFKLVALIWLYFAYSLSKNLLVFVGDSRLRFVLKLFVLLVPPMVFLYYLNTLSPMMAFLEYPILKLGDRQVTLLSLIFAGVVFYIVQAISSLVSSVIEKSVVGRGQSESTAKLFSSIARYVIVIIGAMIALDTAGLDLSTLQIFSGALGIGIGFGLRNIINNLVSGLIVLWERGIKPGDLLEVSGTRGIVDRIGIRSTTIKTFDNVELVLPNSMLVENVITNYTRSDNVVRIKIPVGVSYSSDPNTVREVLINVAKSTPDVLEYPEPYVIFEEFGDSSLNFTLFLWTDKPWNSFFIASKIRFAIWYAFKEKGIEIPFPQLDLHVKDVPEGSARASGLNKRTPFPSRRKGI